MKDISTINGKTMIENKQNINGNKEKRNVGTMMDNI